MNETRQKDPPTFLEAINPVACLILLVGLSSYFFGDERASQ